MKRLVLFVVVCMLVASNAFALSYSSTIQEYQSYQIPNSTAWGQDWWFTSPHAAFSNLTLTITSLSNISAAGASWTIGYGTDGIPEITYGPLGSGATWPQQINITGDALTAVNTCITKDCADDDLFRIRIYTPTSAGVPNATLTGNTAVTPEPATMLLMGAGLAGLPAVRRFRKKIAE